jgi:uncharacterized protein GlcG (DUF336 family)
MSTESGAPTNGHLTRRQALGYGGAAAATVAAASMLASSPASAAETDDDERSRGGSTVLRSVSLAQANRIAAAAVRYVRENDLPPMYVLVVDVAGNEKASRRMDGNGIASLALVPAKARTALGFRAVTLEFGAGTTDPGRIASFTTAGFSLLGGGRPIVEDEVLIGAVAVGGGSPEQDDEVAAAALAEL